MALRRGVPVYQHGTVEVISLFQHGFCNFNFSFCSSITFRMVRGWCGVFKPVLNRELSVVFTDKLWSIISVADGCNTVSCEVSFCFSNDF